MKRALAPGVLVIMLAFSVGCSTKRLLLVTQYEAGSERVEAIKQSIVNRFKAEGASYRLTIFDMDTLSHPTDTWREEMGHMAVIRVHDHDPDVVFVAGDDAARYFAQRLVNRPWRFIFLDVKGDPADYLFTVSVNATGVREKVAVEETFDLIRNLVPSARRVAVLADRSLEGNAVVDQIKAVRDSELHVVIKRAATLAEWLAAVQAVQDEADVLIVASCSSVLLGRNATEAVSRAELLQLTSRLNRLPDFSFWKEAVGPEGVMAAVWVPVAAQADLAGEMAVRMLFYDADISRIRIVSSKKRATAVDLERAKKFGVAVPAALLKPDPKLRERKRNFLERFLGLFMIRRRPPSL